ncbi:MAG: prepilin-type N-terminal cleavage/methylation domain-containing protein [Thermoanaerobaculia bacterium]
MRRERGFTLIELLIVIAIIAIIAAIATLSYFNSIDRARQKRTMNDIRQIAAAWEARATDTNSYSAAGYNFPTTDVTYETLHTALTPTYTKNMPRTDGWGTAFEFATGGDKEYAVRSAGKDKTFQGDEYTAGGTQESDCDIVYGNGSFIVYPQGIKPK